MYNSRFYVIFFFILSTFTFNLEGSFAHTRDLNKFIPRAPFLENSNIILIIGDGMGHAHRKAARIFSREKSKKLFFEKFPRKVSIETSSRGGRVTDSAASATAMATGFKVRNGVISWREKEERPATSMEVYKYYGKKVGFITTSEGYDATPAAFFAHTQSRKNHQGILNYYLAHSRPDVIIGDDLGKALSNFKHAGYFVLNSNDELKVQSSKENPFPIIMNTSFNKGKKEVAPELIVNNTLRLLQKSPKGFFLLIEEERIDTFSHANNIEKAIEYVLSLERIVETAVRWANLWEQRTGKKTAIFVTSDHETGGLAITESKGIGHIPSVSWSTKGHTGVPVDLWAFGEVPKEFDTIKSNKDLFSLLVRKN